MPYPRRIAGCLSEKRISFSIIKIVHVSDSQAGNPVVESQAASVPPRLEGSLPILAIPPGSLTGSGTYVRQSMAIIAYLEEATAAGGDLSLVDSRALIKGQTALERARIIELQTPAEEAMVAWNPVKIFGTKAGTIAYPECSKEMLRWVHRTLATVDNLLSEQDLSVLKRDEAKTVSIADIVLFHFLGFIDVYCGVDLTKGSGDTKKDVYGRTIKEEYPNLRVFNENFKQRETAKRDAGTGEIPSEIPGEIPGEMPLGWMSTWHDGVL